MMRLLSGFAILLLASARLTALPLGGADFWTELPADLNAPQPLVATGAAGKGDLVLVGRDIKGQLRFGWDHSGSGVDWGSPVEVTAQAKHRIQVTLDNLLNRSSVPLPNQASNGAVCVLFDGRIAFFASGQLWPAVAADPRVGVNSSGLASASRQFFNGAISESKTWSPEEASISWRQVYRWTPGLGPSSSHQSGPIKLRVLLPMNWTNHREPLIVTGAPGKADSIFIVYADSTHIKVALDHWAVGAAMSEPIGIDYSIPHQFEVDMASFHGKFGPNLPTTVLVDGRKVLDTTMGVHPTTPDQIVFGINNVGASTSEPVFTGKLLGIETQSD
jgi:hypothetical protein